jgi:hypothetical protein
VQADIGESDIKGWSPLDESPSAGQTGCCPRMPRSALVGLAFLPDFVRSGLRVLPGFSAGEILMPAGFALVPRAERVRDDQARTERSCPRGILVRGVAAWFANG